MARKIDRERLQKVSLADQALKEAKEQCDAASGALCRAQNHQEGEVWRLQWLIAKGQTTGDRLLDKKIMVYGNAEKDEVYARMKACEARLKEHAGELVALNSNMSSWDLGVLPEEPELLCRYPEALGAGLNDPNAWMGRLPTGFEVAVRRYQSGLVQEAVVQVSESFFRHDQSHGVVYFREEVEAHYLGIRPGLISGAFELWRASCVLGQPLPIFPDLAKEIQRRREDKAVSLSQLTLKVVNATADLQRAQENPRESAGRATQTWKTATGFTVELPEAKELERARRLLLEEVERARPLQMEDNRFFQQAVGMVASFHAETS